MLLRFDFVSFTLFLIDIDISFFFCTLYRLAQKLYYYSLSKLDGYSIFLINHKVDLKLMKNRKGIVKVKRLVGSFIFIIIIIW